MRQLRFLSSVVAASALSPLGAARSPPIAKRVPHTVKFGRVEGENRGPQPMEPAVELADDLFWLRDDTRSDDDILGLLREENDYTQAQTAHLSQFRETLYDEMLSHVQEDDDTYPYPMADGFEYWSRTVKGASFRQYLRRPRGSATEEVVLDVNTVSKEPFFASYPGWNAAQCDVHEVKPSPSGARLAYAVDGSGYETYAIRLKDLSTGAELEETLRDTGGSIAWTSDDAFFYVKQDPCVAWVHMPLALSVCRMCRMLPCYLWQGASPLPSVEAYSRHESVVRHAGVRGPG